MITQANGVAPPILPHEPEAWGQIIGSLIMEPSLIAKVVKIVGDSEPVDPAHKTAFRGILELRRAGTPIDVISVARHLRGKGPFFDRHVVASYLGEVKREVATSAHAEYWARVARNAAGQSRLCITISDAERQLLNGKEAIEVLNDLKSDLDDFARDFSPRDETDEPRFERWAAAVIGREKQRLFTCAAYGSQLKEIPIGEERVILIGSPPGAGKTALALQLVFDAIDHPGQETIRALIANVEMGPESLLNRRLAAITGVGHQWIQHRDYEASATDRLQCGIDELRATMQRVKFMGPPFTLERLVEQADALPADIVVVDYAQRFDFAQRSSDQRSQANAVMDVCRRIADQGRAVIVISAVNRAGYTKEGAGLGSFRESSELEYGADAAYLLIAGEENRESVTLKCVKNRHGQITDIPLRFNGSLQQFTDDRASQEWTG